MTKEEEKAKLLIEKYSQYVHGYVGSSMLTNYEYPDQILSQSKKVATLECQSIIDELEFLNGQMEGFIFFNPRIDFYKGVIKAIEQQ